MLWSDICLKLEKLEVINWQPENCKDMFSAPREPELSEGASLLGSPQYSVWQRKMMHIIHIVL